MVDVDGQLTLELACTELFVDSLVDDSHILIGDDDGSRCGAERRAGVDDAVGGGAATLGALSAGLCKGEILQDEGRAVDDQNGVVVEGGDLAYEVDHLRRDTVVVLSRGVGIGGEGDDHLVCRGHLADVFAAEGGNGAVGIAEGNPRHVVALLERQHAAVVADERQRLLGNLSGDFLAAFTVFLGGDAEGVEV